MMGKLPNKSEIHETNSRNMGLAIIEIFIRREDLVALHWACRLRKTGLELSNGVEQILTVDLAQSSD